MNQYNPLLPQTSDAFFSSIIPIPPYLLLLLLLLLLLPLLVFVVPFCPTVVTFYTTLDNLVTLQYQLLYHLFYYFPLPLLRLLIVYDYSSPVLLYLPVPLIYSYFNSPPYFLLPPATYPLQQLLAPVLLVSYQYH